MGAVGSWCVVDPRARNDEVCSTVCEEILPTTTIGLMAQRPSAKATSTLLARGEPAGPEDVELVLDVNSQEPKHGYTSQTSIMNMRSTEICDLFDQLDNLSVTAKFYTGNLDMISEHELDELSSCFCTPDLPVENTMLYFREVFHCGEKDVARVSECMQNLVDGNDDCVQIRVFRENLADGRPLSIAIKVLAGAIMFSDRVVKDTKPGETSRKLFLSWIVRTTDRDDCLIALPTTLVYMTIFTICVVMHLRIWSRRELSASLTHWMMRPPDNLLGPFFDEHVGDPSEYKNWLDLTAIDSIYGKAEFDGNFGSEGRPGIAHGLINVASHNVLIGDAWLEKTSLDGSKQTAVFLNTELARAFLTIHPNNFTGAVRASLLDMENHGFFDDNTRELNFILCFYNAPNEAFSLVESSATFDDFGFVEPEVRCFVVMTNAYEGFSAYLVDALFVCFILWVAFNEGKEAVAALRLGCGELWDYLGVSNIIDWGSVFFGCCSCALWAVVVTMLTDERLHMVLRPTPEGRYGRLNVDLDFLSMDSQVTKDMHDALRGLHLWMSVFSGVVAVNSLFVVLKLFKGFQSNNRLKVVTYTLGRASTDIVHFFFVCIPVVIIFALLGHTLFGIDIPEFQSFGSALISCFSVVLGAFKWYTRLFDDFRRDLPSGVPIGVVQAWYVCYMFFVSLVMLNMLVGIILSEYFKSYKQLVTKAPTLLAQFQKYIRTKRETWNYMSLFRIRGLLENDSDPAHPSMAVSVDSLLTAFPGMKLPQAEFILKAISEEIHGGSGARDNLDFVCEEERNVIRSTSSYLEFFKEVKEPSSCFDTLERDLASHGRKFLEESLPCSL
eukprot:TRINITY_DN15825_c0_g2_i1.p1 TRINITY_DN15825_c0_g2~~TRINITY_DN15825_c0_g2_i1.p1  ORF type:complete len:838 (-),score=126.20 TRINITY_DN15825_c0_g2_i1:58-2571(-)